MSLKRMKEVENNTKERKDVDYVTKIITAAKKHNKGKIMASKRNQKILLQMREDQMRRE